MEELRKFQSSTFHTIPRRKLVEDQDIILELTGKILEKQNEINCMSDSRDSQDSESVRSGHSHVTSQPVSFPPHPIPGGMLSRSIGMPSRRDGPPSIWDTHGKSGNVFANPVAPWLARYRNCKMNLTVWVIRDIFKSNPNTFIWWLQESQRWNGTWSNGWLPNTFLSWKRNIQLWRQNTSWKNGETRCWSWQFNQWANKAERGEHGLPNSRITTFCCEACAEYQFEHWFRKVRTIQIDMLLNMIYDKIKHITHLVQNQRKWFRKWATSNCVNCSRRNAKRSAQHAHHIGT